VVQVSAAGATLARTPAMQAQDHTAHAHTTITVAADGVITGGTLEKRGRHGEPRPDPHHTALRSPARRDEPRRGGADFDLSAVSFTYWFDSDAPMLPPGTTVTFDTNTIDKAVWPERHPRDPAQADFQKLHEAALLLLLQRLVRRILLLAHIARRMLVRECVTCSLPRSKRRHVRTSNVKLLMTVRIVRAP
jgi:hypothetical protein